LTKQRALLFGLIGAVGLAVGILASTGLTTTGVLLTSVVLVVFVVSFCLAARGTS
jgi:hypothetical protein